MSIQLYVSNSLSRLARQLSSDLAAGNAGVFVPQQLVTQTEGMNNWLTIKIAEQTGIAANCTFNKPNDIVSQIYYWLGGKNKPLLAVDFVKWNIYHLLNDTAFIRQYPFIAGYYAGNDVKQIALASRVADLFDQYQMYRPDMITEWNKTDISDSQIDFQQYLWARIQLLTEDKMQDKTGMIQQIIDALQYKDKQQILQSKMPQLQFFGIAVITPFYLELFNELSKHIAIRFYLINPAPTCYWLEDKSEKEIARIVQKAKNKPGAAEFSTVGNSLLNSWGTIIRESFSLLFEDENYINQYNDDLAEEPSTPDTLLKKIQQDIYLNAPDDSRNGIETADLKDGSITINTCFTPVREVEVLYNYLVALVDQQGEKMSARDVVVMVSDIDLYAPYIRAVFDNAPYRFPYTIADESIVTGNNIFHAIESVLSLQADSFKAEEILELLESKYIRDRFFITDIEAIRNAVDAANIRFGMAGEAVNDTRLVSWEYGLQRIMYGICISGEPMLQIGTDTLIPLDTTEGNNAEELIRFWHLMQVLQFTVLQRDQPRTIANWVAYLQELIENLVFQSGEKEEEDYHRLVDYLEKINVLDAVSDSPVSFEVFRHSFLEILNTDKRSQVFAGLGITFCSLIPMRSIPFKVVAMLGMNFDKFPRKESKLSFNLLEKITRKGDRNVKNNDKHLFLETILSAEKYFYLSYIGRNAKDAAAIPPSSLVDELIGYIVQGVQGEHSGKLADMITTAHPLHGFSQQYFNGSGLFSYLSDDRYKNNEPVPATEKEAVVFAFDEVMLKDLQQFFKDPIKWYFNKSLGIYYREEATLLPDTEVFDIDTLSNWQLKNDLLNMPETEYENYYTRQSLQGVLPLKNMGRLAFDDLVNTIAQQKILLLRFTNNAAPETIEINISLGNSIISGKINSIYENGMLAFTDSASYKKHVVEAIITYIAATAQGFVIDFIFIPFKSKKIFTIKSGTISQEQALERLGKMLAYFKAGYSQPFLFCPGFSGNPFKLFENDAAAFTGAIETMRNSKYDYTFNDPYMVKAFENDFFSSDNFEEMKENTLDIFEEIEAFMPGVIK
jgi:exodeoxyribonuclease V gamma subunit